jgi:hypothetical protein
MLTLMRLSPIAMLSICLVGSCAAVEDDPLSSPDDTELAGEGDPIGPAAAIEPAAEQCGDIVCPAGTTCCDPLDGECVRKGMECPLAAPGDDTVEQDALEPVAEQCGGIVCPVGTTCCDPLDGECVRKGMECPL